MITPTLPAGEIKKPLHEREKTELEAHMFNLIAERQCKDRIIFRIIGMKVRKRQLRHTCREAKGKKSTKNTNFFNSNSMKTMNSFAAQQLSKKQMNDVKGGDIYCALYYQDSNGNLINEAGLIGGANSTSEAKEMAKSKYTSIGYKLVIADCIED